MPTETPIDKLHENSISASAEMESASGMPSMFDLLPLEVFQALGQDLTDAVTAVQEAWQSDADSFQSHYDDWKQRIEAALAGFELAINTERNNTEHSKTVLNTLDIQRTQLERLRAANDQFLTKVVDLAPGLESKHLRLLQFAQRQARSFIDVCMKVAEDFSEKGKFDEAALEAAKRGAEKVQHDLKQGLDYHISRCPENAYKLGEDLAATDGEVIYQNDLIQLIHYRPVGAEVSALPMLLVPPCINKFYILDLTEELSLVRKLLSQGIDLYMISWRNPSADDAEFGLYDYIEKGVQSSADFICSRSDADKLHLAGYCIGGLFAALAAADEEPDSRLASLTLLNTLLDYSDPGELEVFLSERMVDALSDLAKREGIVRGNLLSWAFTLLRERQLFWPYWISRYLRGEEPPKDPVMFWNQDVANLPADMMSEYLRNLYLENRFFNGDVPVLGGKKLSLKNISVPTYGLACVKDHIVGWKESLGALHKISGESRAVLASGGHVLGVLSPSGGTRPSQHWIIDPAESEKLDTPGRDKALIGPWWADWIDWLHALNGEKTKPLDWKAEQKGSLEKAPGSYVRASS